MGRPQTIEKPGKPVKAVEGRSIGLGVGPALEIEAVGQIRARFGICGNRRAHGFPIHVGPLRDSQGVPSRR